MKMQKAYLCKNVVRILNLEDDFAKSRMIDIDIENGRVLSEFDGTKPFDCAFIKSHLNIIKESKAGFRPLSDSPEDVELQNKAIYFATRG